MNKRSNGTDIYINIFFLLLGFTFYFVGSFVGINACIGSNGIVIAIIFCIVRHKCSTKVINYAGIFTMFVYLVSIEVTADAFTQEYALFLFGALLVSLNSKEELIKIYLLLNFAYYVISFIVLLAIHGPQDYMVSQLVHGIILISGIIIIFSYVTIKNASERSFIQESQNFQALVKVVDAKKKTALKATKAKGDFLANMSHEIRTPMNAIIGMTGLALKEDMSPQAKEYIYRIKQSGRSLLSIINDILDYSKIESGKMDIIETEYNLAHLIDNVAGIINTRINDKRIELIINYNPKIPGRLYGDESRITQVLINLMNNAVKYTDTGYVALIVDFGLDDNGIILNFKVSDTGIGIKTEDINRIFNLFEQADKEKNKSVEGTGLGLAICKSLVEAMGGNLHVKSEYGCGSEFSFSIFQRTADYAPGLKINNVNDKHIGIIASDPYIKTALVSMVRALGVKYRIIDSNDENIYHDVNYIFCNNEYTQEYMDDMYTRYSECNIFVIVGNEDITVPDSVSIVRKPLLCQKICACLNNINYSDYYYETNSLYNFTVPEGKLLIVDDNVINLKVACGILKPLMISVDTATSGEEAISLITKNKYDIVFMDQMMPGMDGIETVTSIRNMEEEYYEIVPIIALTANATAGVQEMFISKGFNGYLAKPVEFNEVSKMIRDWISPKKIVYNDGDSIKTDDEDTLDLTIEGLDIQNGIKKSGSVDIYLEILKDFAQSSEMKIGRITKGAAISTKDYITEVHGLKSTASLVGADDLSDMARRIEESGKVEYEEMLELISKFRLIAGRINNVFGEEKHENADDLTDEELLSMLNELGSQLVDYNIDEADRILNSMKKRLGHSKSLQELEDALFNADYEGAINTIESIKKCGELL